MLSPGTETHTTVGIGTDSLRKSSGVFIILLVFVPCPFTNVENQLTILQLNILL